MVEGAVRERALYHTMIDHSFGHGKKGANIKADAG